MRLTSILFILISLFIKPIWAQNKNLTLEQKAAQGEATSQYELANKHANDKKSLSWYQKAAKQGHPQANKKLGDLYFNGNGVKQNLVKASEYYRVAAQEGEPNAAYALARMYYTGYGIPVNIEKAAQWYQFASRQNHIEAHYHLGDLYTKGKGVERNLKAAFEHFETAAQANHIDAQMRLGLIYAHGLGTVKNIDKSIYWLKQSAQNGQLRAQYKLGWTLMHHKPEQYRPEALAWVTLASENGSNLSRFYEKKLNNKLSIDEIKASKRLVMAFHNQGL